MLSLKKTIYLVSCILILLLIAVGKGYSEIRTDLSEKIEYLNITNFGTCCYWNKTDSVLGYKLTGNDFPLPTEKEIDNIGMRWWNARDIQRFEVVCSSRATAEMAASMQIEYWNDNWPDEPPHMPSYEDHEDDLWRGKWITAKTDVVIEKNKIVFSFQPLAKDEIANAEYLPGKITYRRTLKMRVKFPEEYREKLEDINVFSMADVQAKSIRVEFLQSEKKTKNIIGYVEVFNGSFKGLSGWNWKNGDKKAGKNGWSINTAGNGKGIILKVLSANALLPGSNEETVVTLRTSNGTFSFSTADLSNGPVYVPRF